MAKSIRSKGKRKSRREFRQTLGQQFRDAKMKEIQTKLHETVAKQSTPVGLTTMWSSLITMW